MSHEMVVTFERSEACAEHLGFQLASKKVVLPARDGLWTQITYQYLRDQDGEFLAEYHVDDGCWWYDGEPWSDIVVEFKEAA